MIIAIMYMIDPSSGMYFQIRDFVRGCPACLEQGNKRPKVRDGTIEHPDVKALILNDVFTMSFSPPSLRHSRLLSFTLPSLTFSFLQSLSHPRSHVIGDSVLLSVVLIRFLSYRSVWVRGVSLRR